jgi:hypothetical protein
MDASYRFNQLFRYFCLTDIYRIVFVLRLRTMSVHVFLLFDFKSYLTAALITENKSAISEWESGPAMEACNNTPVGYIIDI